MRMHTLAIITAFTFSGFAQATELICESSHLSVPAPNLEQIATNLAKLRLQIYQMPTVSEKSRANEEFKAKYSEFETIIGNKDQAENLFQAQMKLAKPLNSVNDSKESERKEKEQREREKEATDPVNLAHKMIFNEIKPGIFMMGEEEKVEVEITKPFSMMSTQVTQLMWAYIKVLSTETDPTKNNPSHFKNGEDTVELKLNGISLKLQPDHPVENFTWDELNDWIDLLNALSNSESSTIQDTLKKLIPGHQKGDAYDLPSNAQWEFVMRDRGKANKRYFDRDDSNDLHKYSWSGHNSDYQTHAVAKLAPRMIDDLPFYDLEGNVWELTKDRMDTARYAPTGGQDPLQTIGNGIIKRGGSWKLAHVWHHSSSVDIGMGGSSSQIGFRLVRTRP